MDCAIISGISIAALFVGPGIGFLLGRRLENHLAERRTKQDTPSVLSPA